MIVIKYKLFFLLLLLSFSCVSNNSINLPEHRNLFHELSVLDEVIIAEDFTKTEIDPNFNDVVLNQISESCLHINGDGDHLYFEDPQGFTRIVACYKLTSNEGHIFLSLNSEDGHFALFNDVLGDWAWKDFEDGGQRFNSEYFGQEGAGNTGQWIIHELIAENEKLKYVVNGNLLGEVNFQKSGKMKNISVRANGDGRGMLDYLVIMDNDYNKRYKTNKYKIETIIPPAETISAPFDSAVLPDGRIVMKGSKDKLVSVDSYGRIKQTDYPAGTNFECSLDGIMYYYNFPEGSFYSYDPHTRKRQNLSSVPESYNDGGIAVSPDGKTVYIGWWLSDKGTSALYQYTQSEGLKKILSYTNKLMIRGVEVTADNLVYLLCNDGIYQLNNTAQVKKIFNSSEFYPTSDGITSDENGNLYFTAAINNKQGLHMLTPQKTLTTILSIPNDIDLPFGLSWHQELQTVIGVRKVTSELLSIDLDGNQQVLNKPTGLITPIAIEENPNGQLMVNGDEVGLLNITFKGTVTRFGEFVCSFQPPQADFIFDQQGNIYYTEAAPGFSSSIIVLNFRGEIFKRIPVSGKPAGIDCGPDDNIYFVEFSGTGGLYQVVNQKQIVPLIKDILFPKRLVIDSQQNYWIGAASKDKPLLTAVLGEVFNNCILKYNEDGELLETITIDDNGVHDFGFFDIDRDGNLYVPDRKILWKRSPNAEWEIISSDFHHLGGVIVHSDGNIYVIDHGSASLYRIILD